MDLKEYTENNPYFAHCCKNSKDLLVKIKHKALVYLADGDAITRGVALNEGSFSLVHYSPTLLCEDCVRQCKQHIEAVISSGRGLSTSNKGSFLSVYRVARNGSFYLSELIFF